MREQFVQHKSQFFKQLTKSWYIAAFQLPFLAPTVWQFFSPEHWGKVLSRLEGRSDLPLNHHIAADGKHGVATLPQLTLSPTPDQTYGNALQFAPYRRLCWSKISL